MVTQINAISTISMWGGVRNPYQKTSRAEWASQDMEHICHNHPGSKQRG